MSNRPDEPAPETQEAMAQQLPAHDFFLDARGMICPLPALRARRKLAEMEAGKILLIHATDADAPEDIFALCHVGGHDYISSTETRDKKDNRVYEILVRRGG